jgi:hypothetical protein
MARFTAIRVSVVVFAGLWGALTPAVATTNSAPTNTLFLLGIEHLGPAARFWIGWEHLPSRVTWCPIAQSFPLDLHAEAARAQAHLAAEKGITNRMKLNSIEIRRLAVPRWQLEAHAKGREDLSNHWYVVFSWGLEGAWIGKTTFVRHEHAIVMLDGALAIQTPTQSKLPPPTQTGNYSAQDLLALRPPGSLVDPNLAAYPGVESVPQELNSRGFIIPSVVWDPHSEVIPIDISRQADGARRAVVEKFGLAEELLLAEMEITRFRAGPFIKASGDSVHTRGTYLWGDLGHWCLTYYFSTATAPAEHAYRVYALLDERILNVVRVGDTRKRFGP